MIAFIDGDPMLYQAAWGRTFEQAKKHLHVLRDWTLGDTFATDCCISLGTDYNFRSDFFEFYKKSPGRVNSKSNLPDWMPDLKDYLSKQQDVVQCFGFESDDLLRIWSLEAEDAGDPFVLCSIDKDLDCIPGLHYTSKTRKSYTVTREYADKFFWQQCLTGDNVDNIPGIPGVGPVKAVKILEGASTESECRERVVMAYKERYGKDWWEYLMSNFRLLYMWREMEDYVVVDRALHS